MFGSGFYLLLNLNYLTVQVTLQHLETMQCNWLVYIYIYMYMCVYIYMHIYTAHIHMYMCVCISNFLLVFPDILTPDTYQNDLSCWCNWECPCKYG